VRRFDTAKPSAWRAQHDGKDCAIQKFHNARAGTLIICDSLPPLRRAMTPVLLHDHGGMEEIAPLLAPVTLSRKSP